MNNQQKKRPVNLNLFAIRLPMPALVSILHRLSGLALFFAIPGVLWLLDRSLASYGSFNKLTTSLNSSPLCKLAIIFTLSAFMYHLTAGIRHILMDFNMGESLRVARFSAALTLIINILFVIGLGVRLW